MNLSAATTALGIDIAKAKFDVCLIKQNGRAKHKVFGNSLAWLGRNLSNHGFKFAAATCIR